MLRSCITLAARFSRNRASIGACQPVRYGIHEGLRGPAGVSVRLSSTTEKREKFKAFTAYLVAIAVAFGGLSFLAVPLYRIFCQVTVLNEHHFFFDINVYCISLPCFL